MKCTLLAVLYLLFISLCNAQAQPEHPIVPLPQKLEWTNGAFIFNQCTRLQFDQKNKALGHAVAPLVQKFKKAAAINLLAASPCTKPSVISVLLSKSIPNEEGYQLSVQPGKISIRAQGPAGVYYAVQTLLQLLPPAIESPVRANGESWQAPGVYIEDAPRFPYRGIMLDVARHMMPVDSIKRLIDLLAMQKMNRLHWHLTDNDGWRFESKKHPKLTQVGAFRKGSPIGNNITYNYNSLPNDTLYGGYYTQAQMKDLVQYAAARFVTIIPEIEMPAHAMAAIASYPQLACLDANGQPFSYPENIQGEFCTREETFQFLNDVLSEVMAIFPSRYIHIGGDEAEKENWKTCTLCRKRMKEEGITDVHGLQSYFIHRIEKFVNSRGRSIIGWDEIMEGGVAPNAAVMSWTGIKNGIEAARKHHEVVMTPLPYCYLDHPQSSAPGEPIGYPGLTMLSNVYEYDPMPKELDAAAQKFLKGAQGNLWTEYVPTAAKADYMLFPRSVALAEITWSQPGQKSYADFIRRLLLYNKRLDFHRVNYSKHLFDIRLGNLEHKEGNFFAPISGSLNNLPVYYTLDVSTPTERSAVYTGPVPITQTATLTAAIYLNGELRDLQQKKYILHKGVGKKGVLAIAPDYMKGTIDAWHNGSLCDDKRMNDERFMDEERYNDDKWLGWMNKNFEGTLDFGQAEKISKVSMRFYHNIPYGILIPRTVSVLASDDGVNFKTIASQQVAPPEVPGATPVVIAIPATAMRFLKIVATPYGKTPAGNMAYLFVDEVVVE